jgi:hypothetical protein
MFEKLNKFLFRMRAQKYLKETPRERRFVSYSKAKTVLILFESDFSEKNPTIRKMISQLQQDGKKVSAWGFIDKKEVVTSILPDFRILHHKQTDFFQKPIISYLNELESLEFDLLIDLSINSILALQYIALYANASCKTGMHKTELPIYDFMIDIENQPTELETSEPTDNPIDENYLFNQIIFYLKSIQTND